MPKYELDALRAIRSMQQTHELADHGPMAERMRAIGDQVEAMADQLRTMKTALRAKDADYVALKEAARVLIHDIENHMYCESVDGSNDALAALVGEG